MTKGRGKLSSVDLEALPAGLHHDQRGLYLQVATSGARSWLFRYRYKGRIRHMGLGGLDKVSLPQARAEHKKWLTVLWAKLDPIAERDRKIAAEHVDGLKFGTLAADYIAVQKPSWRSDKTGETLQSLLTRYAYPTLGELPIAAITRQDILATLQPIWLDIPKSAFRLRALIAAIFDFAISKNYVDKNPADWRTLKDALPRRGKVAATKHHAAMNYRDLPDFMADLREVRGISARALEFLILTATRTGEARRARWDELDLEKAVWTIPPHRRKRGGTLRVPLCARAVEIVRSMIGLHDVWVFCPRRRKPLAESSMLECLRRQIDGADSVHGFRSSFRDWVSEQTKFGRDLAELALGHVVGDTTERSYARSDQLENRVALMAAWGRYVAGETEPVRLVGAAE
jgi:integrase